MIERLWSWLLHRLGMDGGHEVFQWLFASFVLAMIVGSCLRGAGLI